MKFSIKKYFVLWIVLFVLLPFQTVSAQDSRKAVIDPSEIIITDPKGNNVTEEDVREVFADVCSHRIILTQKARAAGATQSDVLKQILGSVKLPYSV